MGAHLIFCGPSTAGKTSLMLGLSKQPGGYDFNVDKTWTTRKKRPNETDEENIFVTPEEFESNRDRFLLPFQTFPTYEYGIDKPRPLNDKEIRMRILMPTFAIKFRDLVEEPTVLCSVAPFCNEPERIFRERDPGLDDTDLQSRLSRFYTDEEEARSVSDISFQNFEDIELAVNSLKIVILHHLQHNNL